jgi:thiamine-phosphate pyrophosphorylase
VGVRIGRYCTNAGALFILNDHAHLVGSVGAQGVHLGQLDVDTITARKQMPVGALLGRSTHSLVDIDEALRDADYLAFGPIWPTTNTDRDKGSRGLDELAKVRQRVPKTTPLVAIGGVTADRLPALLALGVDAWAVIGTIRDADDRVRATQSLLRI